MKASAKIVRALQLGHATGTQPQGDVQLQGVWIGDQPAEDAPEMSRGDNDNVASDRPAPRDRLALFMGRRLAELRQTAGLPLAALAQPLGIETARLAAIEAGTVRAGAEQVGALAALLNVSISAFYTAPEPPASLPLADEIAAQFGQIACPAARDQLLRRLQSQED